MCVGIPMQVMAPPAFGFAPCAPLAALQREPVHIDLRIVDEPAVGTWVLVFDGAARRLLSAEEAQQTGAALLALEVALSADGATAQGRERIDALFADLLDRPPQLPAHLRPT